MQVRLQVQRYNPERDSRPHLETYDGRGRARRPGARPAGAGQGLPGRQRWPTAARAATASAARTPCASTASTAWRARCWCARSASEITVEPLLGLPVLKDLIVDIGAVLRALPLGAAVSGQRRAGRQAANGVRARASGRASTTRPSASCAPPAPPPARPSGATASTSGRRPSSRRIASSSTAATGPRPSACRS